MTKPWREGLPVRCIDTLTLREVEDADAASLAQHLGAEEVARSVSSPPPRTATAFERWISGARTQRASGKMACFAIVPSSGAHAVGIIQLFRLENESEWGLGFALGHQFWGTGIFQQAARAALAIAFDTLHATRVEATCLVDNARGNRALEKLGAVCTGTALQIPDPDGNIGDFRKWEFRAGAIN
jgi:ribosomal-protein-alanine N-acetyltransferase